MIEITSNPLSPDSIAAALSRAGNGALVLFTGMVRSPSQGKEVLFLEYEAYSDMAEKKLRQIVEEMRYKWQLHDVSISHRVGKLAVGDAALVVAVAAPHRREAFDACQYAVDRVKDIVPIWKKEVYRNGEAWVEHRE